MSTNQYLDIFIEEATENLQNLNQALLQLESNPEDSSLLNSIFRIAHTLKGMAGTMGFNKMSGLTHIMEDVLQKVKNGVLVLSEELINLLFRSFDALEDYVKSIINSGNEGVNEYHNLIHELRNIDGQSVHEKDTQENDRLNTANNIMHLDKYVKNIIEKAHEMGMNVYRITIYLDKGCVLKSARAFVIFRVLEMYSDIIKSEPEVMDIEDEKFDFMFSVIIISREDKDVIIKELYKIAEVEKVELDVLKKANEIPQKDIAASKDVTTTIIKDSRPTKTIRVDIQRLDVLLNLVGELIIQKTRLEEVYDEKSQIYEESLKHLERIISSLHDAVMKVRMVPVEIVFNRFPRMIRDLSKKLDKEIVLVMSGEDTELDRTVVDEIGEPLVHLLRNSVDHGIETPGKRLALGKPEQGHINLRAYQDGDNVVIEVEDDGQGINIEKVKEKAIEKGITTLEEIKTATEKQILELLFLPSMSTADTISSLSGRGVGLDVVKTKIESLGGIVEIETRKGKGTKFIIRLPLTLAMIQALLVYIGEERYAIPLSSVKQIVKIKPQEIKEVQKREILLMGETIIPIVKLNQVLDIQTEKDKQSMTIVIVSKGEKLYGLAVDNLIGQQEIVIKNVGKYLSGIKTISGATILGDGKVALILDLNYIAQ